MARGHAGDGRKQNGGFPLTTGQGNGSDVRIDANGPGRPDGGVETSGQRYVLSDYRWPAAQTTVTWSFNDLTLDSDGDREDALGASLPDDYREIVREAMQAWESVCGVRFVEVGDNPGANVRIGWQPAVSQDPDFRSDGPGNTLGITWSWHQGNTIDEQAIAFDPAEPWTSTMFYDTALHELGHVLGISHSDVHDVVLSGPPHTRYSSQPGRDQLRADDIAAARELWGPPEPPERITGTPGNDTLSGGSGADVLHGDGGDDRLLGGAGNDSILGGPGDDRLWGQDGRDTLDGGEGEDILFGMDGQDSIDGGYGGDIILGGAGNDSVVGDMGGRDDGTSAAADRDGDDRIWGEDGNDTLRGEGGRDFLAGGAGNDVMYGEVGVDYLAGGDGSDTLHGGTGYDVLAGGSGDDTLIGGAEGDTFFGQSGADRFEYNGGTVWVMDFEIGRDVLSATNGATFTSSAQAGAHARYDLSDGGTIFLAWTNVDEAGFTNSAQADAHARHDLSDGDAIFPIWTNVDDADGFGFV